MTEAPQPIERNGLDDITRFIHLGLTVFGILALITGLWAGDYKRAHHLWFSVHKWLGLTLTFSWPGGSGTGFMAPGRTGSANGFLSLRNGSNWPGKIVCPSYG